MDVEMSEATTGGRRALGMTHGGGIEKSSHTGAHACPLLKAPMWAKDSEQKPNGTHRDVKRLRDRSQAAPRRYKTAHPKSSWT